MVRVKLGYPSPEEESDILLRFERDVNPPALDPVTERQELEKMQDTVTTVRVDDTVREYIVQIVQASRQNDALSLGASPRAGLALYKTAQARSAIDGRDFVTPDDVKALTESVLSHRIIPNSTSRLRGRTAEMIVEDILAAIPVPIER
jgi:MoxR-like ATPase